MRMLRATLFSAVCVSASGCAHALASQAALAWESLLVGWLVMLCLAAPLAGRERSRPGIVAMLLCGQVAMHVVFALGQFHSAAAGAAGTAVPAVHHSMPGVGASLMPGPVMFALHLAAAALLGSVVYHGDRALWRLIRVSRRAAGALTGALAVLLRVFLAYPPDLPLHVMPVAGTRPEAEFGSGGTVLLHHALVRRGPPMIV
ncbi:hypothetical protein ABTW95_29960 [Spirillospora sp. NPDC127506]